MPTSFQQHLDHRRQAVGGAGGIGNDVVLGRVVLVLVDAQHDGDVFILRRGGDDDLLHRRAQVRLGLGRVGKVPGRFHHNLRAHVGPGQLGRILLREHLDLLAVHGDESSPAMISFFRLPRIESYLSRCASVAGLVKSLTATNSISVLPKCGAKYVAANPAKAVDANLHCHVSFLLRGSVRLGLKKIVAFGGWRGAAIALRSRSVYGQSAIPPNP